MITHDGAKNFVWATNWIWYRYGQDIKCLMNVSVYDTSIWFIDNDGYTKRLIDIEDRYDYVKGRFDHGVPLEEMSNHLFGE